MTSRRTVTGLRCCIILAYVVSGFHNNSFKDHVSETVESERINWRGTQGASMQFKSFYLFIIVFYQFLYYYFNSHLFVFDLFPYFQSYLYSLNILTFFCNFIKSIIYLSLLLLLFLRIFLLGKICPELTSVASLHLFFFPLPKAPAHSCIL